MFQRRPALLCTLILVAVFGCNNASQPKPDGGDPQPRQITREDFIEAIRLKNRSLGHLENKEWAEAEATLTALVKIAPDARLPRRNLAISRVLAVIDRGSPFPRSGPPENLQKYNGAVKSAKEAIAALRESATQSFDKAFCDLLLGQLLVHEHALSDEGIDAGIASIRKATEAMPQAADFQFALAMAMDGHRDYTDPSKPKSAELLQALKQSFELAPENLSALQKLMQRQALFLRSEVPETKQLALEITETLKAAVDLLAPFNESIKQQRRTDLVSMIRAALDAYDASQPQTLMGPAMMTGNLLAPEIATLIDQRRLNRNILEYVLTDFDPEFLEAARAAGAFPADSPSVLKAFASSTGLPNLTDVSSIDLLDMNLDGIDDLVVARDGAIEIYARESITKTDWKLILEAKDPEIAFTGFLLADIDRDHDRAISELKSPSILRDADGDQRILKDPAGKQRWFDTDLDLIAWSKNGVRVYRNDLDENEERVLKLLPQEISVADINEIVAADLEADGDLDLVFATAGGLHLWKNLDGTTFENMDESARLPDHGLVSLAVVDWNQDIAMDIVGVSESGQGGVLENVLHGRFRWVPFERRIAPADGADRISDIHITGPNLAGRFELWCAGAGALPQPTDTATGRNGTEVRANAVRRLFADFDNDGTIDFFNLGGTSLDVSTSLKGVDLPGGIFAVDGATTDFDDDGDIDVVYVEAETGAIGLLTNEGGNSNNWVDIVARGKPDDPQFPSQRVNMHAIGSIIELRAGNQYSAQVITRPRIHIGLGKATAAETVRIIWTDGVPQHVTIEEMLSAKLGILAPQILSGSCPYIYTWTGDRFEFFSDCLWAAPIGLVQASGELAPTREWENLLIPGTALAEKNGYYIIQLTEELHETAYFDKVRLTAVDHPADVNIFTNEKVGSPAMAEHRIHTVKKARIPASVVDGRGNNLLPGLQHADGDYIQAFQRRIMQGLTDDWVMEFDLGNLQEEFAAAGSQRNLRLFLTGWVFPTDTSLNEGILQNPSLNPPAPPSIEVPDGNGGWKTVRPFIGFPSGKTKAMVVDLTNLFSGADFRFRVRSSMELYWDQAFFTLNESDAETATQTCELSSADLHYRGFSRRRYANNALFRNGHAPEDYDYDSVRTESVWPAIAGRFTRYGDTIPLLREHDDLMVVMGPGDELTVSFAVPDRPIPEGWVRDFILHNVGYDKDANLNTIYGQSSEPFPFRAMSRYPFTNDDQPPNSPKYQQFLDEWQTRQYVTAPFWNAVRQQAINSTDKPNGN